MTIEDIEARVRSRLIEAAEIERALPGVRVKPQEYAGAWPEIAPPAWEDIVQYGTKRLEEMRVEFFQHFRGRVSPEQIHRMDETAGWVRAYVTNPDHRRGVFAWARMKAGGLSLRRWCRKNHIGINTAKRWSDAAIEQISGQLGKVPDLRGLDEDFGMVTPTPEIGTDLGTLGTATDAKIKSWLAPDARPEMPDLQDPEQAQQTQQNIEDHNKRMRERARRRKLDCAQVSS